MPDTENDKKKSRPVPKRLFLTDDNIFLQQNNVKHKHFTDRLADFTAFDAQFDAAFAADWLAKIEAAEAMPTDESTVDELKQHSGKLLQYVAGAIGAIADVEYYALKAFKTEPEALYEFRFDLVRRPDQYDLNFVINCIVIRELAEHEYNAELLNAGMPPTVLTALETALDNLTSVEIKQEVFKRIRLKRTRLRVKALNEIYNISEQVRQAAQSIYRTQPEVAGVWG